MNKSLLLVIGLVLVVIVVAFSRGDLRNPVSTVPRDAFAGTWSAKAPEGAEYPWYVSYSFDGTGNYSMRTDSAYKEDGTYQITEHRENGSLLVHKTYTTSGQSKEYDMEAFLDTEAKTITIDGMVLAKE